MQITALFCLAVLNICTTITAVDLQRNSATLTLEGGIENGRLEAYLDSGTTVRAAVVQDASGNMRLVQKQSVKKTDAIAFGVFEPTLKNKGWDQLTVTTSADFPDVVQARAAGYLEGSLTAPRVWDIYGAISGALDQKAKPKVFQFIDKQHAFLTAQVAAHQREREPAQTDMPVVSSDAYWHNVGLVLAQLEGLRDGYNAHMPADKQLTTTDIWLMNNDGDTLDIERAVVADNPLTQIEKMSTQQLIQLVSFRMRCSALVKWTGDDVLAGHTTWADFREMIRIYKHFNLNFNHPSCRSRRVSFSSYPGFLFSSDDFYELDT